MKVNIKYFVECEDFWSLLESLKYFKKMWRNCINVFAASYSLNKIESQKKESLKSINTILHWQFVFLLLKEYFSS